MSIRRNSRNANSRRSDQEGEETCTEEALEECHVVRDRLRNLLSTDKRQGKAHNIFSGFQPEEPKLRESIVDRVLHKVVCSTPMPTERQRKFFPSGSSCTNLSSIDTASEEEDNKEQPNNNNWAGSNENKVFYGSSRGVLKEPLAVVVVDSSSENEDEAEDHFDGKAKDNNKKKIVYNTRSQSKIESIVNSSKTMTAKDNLASRKKMDKPAKKIQCKTPNDFDQESHEQNASQPGSRSRRRNILIQTKPGVIKSKSPSQRPTENESHKVHESPNKTIHSKENSDYAPVHKSQVQEIKQKQTLQSKKISGNKADVKEPTPLSCSLRSRPNDLEPNVVESAAEEVYNNKGSSGLQTPPRRPSTEINEVLGSLGLRSCSSNRSRSEKEINQKQTPIKDVVIPIEDIAVGRKRESKENNVNKDCEVNNEMHIASDDAVPAKDVAPRKLSFPQKNPTETDDCTESQRVGRVEKSTKIPVLRSRSKSKEKLIREIPRVVKLDDKTNNLATKSFAKPSEDSGTGPTRLERTTDIPENVPVSKEPLLDPSKELPNVSTTNLSRAKNIPPSSKSVVTQTADNMNVRDDQSKDIINNGTIRAELIEAGTSPCVPWDSTDGHLEKAPPPMRISVGTSPVCFDNERPEDVELSKSPEVTTKDGLLTDRATVEFASSPKAVMNTTGGPRKTDVVDMGTSPLEATHFGYRRDLLIDNEKVEKLNQLLDKMSRKFFSPDTPVVEDTRNTRVSLKENPKKSQTGTPERVPCPKTNREIQTSSRRSARKATPRKNFARSILTKIAIEQQTQTTDSVDKTLKTYRRRRDTKANGFVSDGGSRNSSTTDQSEILKEFERERDEKFRRSSNMLFKTLSDGILPLTLRFSSSEDEVGCSLGRQSMPWRLDDDAVPAGRRSSCKLSFLRSAREIEMERRTNAHAPSPRNPSDAESEAESLGRVKKQRPKKKAVVGYTRKKKLQVYRRASDEKIGCSRVKKVPPREPIDDERSSSPVSLRISETHLDFETDVPDKDREPSISRALVEKDNAALKTRLTIKNLKEHDKRQEAVDRFVDNVVDPVGADSPVIEKVVEDTVNENESAPKEGENKDTHKKTLKSKRESSVPKKKSGVVEEKIEDEILAVPLEDSGVCQLGNEETSLKRRSKRRHKSPEKNLGVNNNESDVPPEIQSEVPSVKATKARRGREVDRLIASELDGVGCSTIGSCELTGVRRSTRERKQTKRRVYGVILASTQKVLRLFNATSTAPSEYSVDHLPEPRTESSKKSTAKKTTSKNKEKSNAKSNRKGGKRTLKLDQSAENVEKATVIPEELNNDVEIGNNDGTIDVTSATDVGTSKTRTTRKSKHTSVISSTSGAAKIGDNDGVIDAASANDAGMSTTRSTRKSKHNSVISSTTGSVETSEVPKKKNKTNKSNRSNKSKASPGKNESAERVSSTSEVRVGRSTNFEVADDDAHTLVEGTVNATETKENCHDDHGNCHDDNENVFLHPAGTPSAMGRTSDHHFACEDQTQITKDSGRSTLLRSTTFDDSRLRTSKTLTGRVGKKYKRKNDNLGTKISKMLSRSVNRSREIEVFSSNEHNVTESVAPCDDKVSRRSSLMQTKPTSGDRINLLSGNEIINMKYVDNTSNYEPLKDNFLVTDFLRLGDGTMGNLKLLPGCKKPMHIARKFNLFYFVLEGEGFIQVHNKTSKVEKQSRFVIPVGVEYSINNLSKEDSLVLGFVKMSPSEPKVS